MYMTNEDNKGKNYSNQTSRYLSIDEKCNRNWTSARHTQQPTSAKTSNYSQRRPLPGDGNPCSNTTTPCLTSVVLNPAEPCPMTERPVMPLLRRQSAIQMATPFRGRREEIQGGRGGGRGGGRQGGGGSPSDENRGGGRVKRQKNAGAAAVSVWGVWKRHSQYSQ